jgi:hypothetical protein
MAVDEKQTDGAKLLRAELADCLIRAGAATRALAPDLVGVNLLQFSSASGQFDFIGRAIGDEVVRAGFRPLPIDRLADLDYPTNLDEGAAVFVGHADENSRTFATTFRRSTGGSANLFLIHVAAGLIAEVVILVDLSYAKAESLLARFEAAVADCRDPLVAFGRRWASAKDAAWQDVGDSSDAIIEIAICEAGLPMVGKFSVTDDQVSLSRFVFHTAETMRTWCGKLQDRCPRYGFLDDVSGELATNTLVRYSPATPFDPDLPMPYYEGQTAHVVVGAASEEGWQPDAAAAAAHIHALFGFGIVSSINVDKTPWARREFEALARALRPVGELLHALEMVAERKQQPWRHERMALPILYELTDFLLGEPTGQLPLSLHEAFLLPDADADVRALAAQAVATLDDWAVASKRNWRTWRHRLGLRAVSARVRPVSLVLVGRVEEAGGVCTPVLRGTAAVVERLAGALAWLDEDGLSEGNARSHGQARAVLARQGNRVRQLDNVEFTHHFCDEAPEGIRSARIFRVDAGTVDLVLSTAEPLALQDNQSPQPDEGTWIYRLKRRTRDSFAFVTAKAVDERFQRLEEAPWREAESARKPKDFGLDTTVRVHLQAACKSGVDPRFVELLRQVRDSQPMTNRPYLQELFAEYRQISEGTLQSAVRLVAELMQPGEDSTRQLGDVDLRPHAPVPDHVGLASSLLLAPVRDAAGEWVLVLFANGADGFAKDTPERAGIEHARHVLNGAFQGVKVDRPPVREAPQSEPDVPANPRAEAGYRSLQGRGLAAVAVELRRAMPDLAGSSRPVSGLFTDGYQVPPEVAESIREYLRRNRRLTADDRLCARRTGAVITYADFEEPESTLFGYILRHAALLLYDSPAPGWATNARDSTAARLKPKLALLVKSDRTQREWKHELTDALLAFTLFDHATLISRGPDRDDSAAAVLRRRRA